MTLITIPKRKIFYLHTWQFCCKWWWDFDTGCRRSEKRPPFLLADWFLAGTFSGFLFLTTNLPSLAVKRTTFFLVFLCFLTNYHYNHYTPAKFDWSSLEIKRVLISRLNFFDPERKVIKVFNYINSTSIKNIISRGWMDLKKNDTPYRRVVVTLIPEQLKIWNSVQIIPVNCIKVH